MAQQEQEAREHIDRLLGQAGWSVMNAAQANIHVARGVAIREFPLQGRYVVPCTVSTAACLASFDKDLWI